MNDDRPALLATRERVVELGLSVLAMILGGWIMVLALIR